MTHAAISMLSMLKIINITLVTQSLKDMLPELIAINMEITTGINNPNARMQEITVIAVIVLAIT